MENIIAYILMVAIGAAVVTATALLIRKFRKNRKEEAERQVRAKAYWSEERAKRNRVEIPESMARYVDSLNNASPVKTPKPRKTEYTTTTSTRSNDSSDDGLLTGMLIGAALDSVMHSGSGGRSTVSESSSSSFGLDDDDSRKSISSSMDWGSSSSSSSSDSWSSSDSGPSSDW